jgi:hypothetical protein
VLSGDQTFHAVGEKTGIPYLEYHNYYRQLLTSGSAWAKSVIVYFNNALFPASSSVVPAPQVSGQIDDVDWEAEFERAVLIGSNMGPISAPHVPVQAANPSISNPIIITHEANTTRHQLSAPATAPVAAPAPTSPAIPTPPHAPTSPAIPTPPRAPTPPAVPAVPAPTIAAAAAPAAKAKTSSKRKAKAKATDGVNEGAGEADSDSAVSVRRSGRKATVQGK